MQPEKGSLEQKIDKQEQYSRRNCVLVHALPENKTENTDDVVISTISNHLNIVISQDDIDRSHRVGKFDPGKGKQRPAIVKFARYYVRPKVFANKWKLKRKGISISESLSKLRLVKLNEAKDQHSFGNVWSYDEKIKYKGSNNKLKFFMIKMFT